MKSIILMFAGCLFIAPGISVHAHLPQPLSSHQKESSTLDEDLAKLIGKWELPPKKNAKGGMDRLEMEVLKDKDRLIIRQTSTRKSGQTEIKGNTVKPFAFRLEQKGEKRVIVVVEKFVPKSKKEAQVSLIEYKFAGKKLELSGIVKRIVVRIPGAPKPPGPDTFDLTGKWSRVETDN